ncbi:MAG: PEP-CTERM sorting domain-containing protein [Phycisphaerales bacterium]
MKLTLVVASIGAACSVANAQLTLQMDVNSMSVQACNALGAPTPFAGIGHSGLVSLGFDPANTSLLDIFLRAGSGPFVSQGFTGTLTDFDGSIMLNNGTVAGGEVRVTVNGNTADPDIYIASFVPNIGVVSTYIGGGFTIQGLTFEGAFDDAAFANVSVAPFMDGNLTGSFLQFNFTPDAQGAAYADVDVFVVPAPATGVLLLAASGFFARRRRR